MLPDIHVTITGYRKADIYLANGWHDAMVSISDPGGTKRGVLRTGRDLLLDFHDSWPQRGRKENGMATEDQVCELISFAIALPNNSRCLIHCGRGKSRSTAAALVVWAARNRGDAAEGAAVRQLFAQAPGSTPNGWVLTLADQLMGTNLIAKCRRYRIKGD